MLNKELLEYFDLLDEDDTDEEIEGFEGIEIESEEGDLIFLSVEELQKAKDEGKVLADLLITK